ncbi:hypothetical protein JAAARDRAFT_32791 [Jaapia argillacea MUCL 33604]|uniref:Uncharacterized protein n=1 Tax=Jaapia argillacea MUCL 33604 TaxID=933084 RepID=A0A067Q097_9AGAM|nr:hypothetical protein JAAARDRAFT_32791 [Jaapia argillacea MUCL 33604]
MSPLGILPFELWSDIFLHCQSIHEVSMTDLTLVCRAWLDVIEQTPELWTNVSLTWKENLTNIPRLQKRLTLSRDLSLTVRIANTLLVMDSEEIRPAILLLKGHVHRMKTLDIVHNYDAQLNYICDILASSPAPRLERVTLAIPDPPLASSRIILSQDSFQSSPRLKEVVFPLHFFPVPTARLLTTLTSLRFTKSSYTYDSNPSRRPNYGHDDLVTLHGILQSCPLLEHFQHSCRHTHPSSVYQPRVLPRITLPYLLSIDVTSPSIGADIVKCIHAPALRSLRIDGSGCPDRFRPEQDGILPRLAEGSPLLQTISLIRISWPRLSYVVLSQRFPNLQHLIFHGCDLSDDIFTNTSIPNWPLLTRLELIEANQVSPNALIEFLRGKSSSSLAEVVIDRCSKFSHKSCLRVSRLVPILIPASKYVSGDFLRLDNRPVAA